MITTKQKTAPNSEALEVFEKLFGDFIDNDPYSYNYFQIQKSTLKTIRAALQQSASETVDLEELREDIAAYTNADSFDRQHIMEALKHHKGKVIR